MARKRLTKIAALALAAVMASESGLTSFVPLTAEAKESAVEEQAVNASASDDNFTWDNATVYFVITDRFENGDTSNDHSYGRSENEVDAANYANRVGTFHGGDLAGLTQKIEDGYFDELGVNALWITAPYEQIHGAMCATGYKHYAYHGYWALDFSNMDANMGTEDDMKKFVDTAHEHGIRVVLDIVLNHVGYADPVTANEYGFGQLSDNWKDVYYNTSESSYQWYHDYSSETKDGKSTMVASGDWVTNWWGPSWVRALGNRLNGYEGVENDDNNPLTTCSDGLPDIKTENGSDNGLPKILETKWKKEGRYETEMAELDQFFQDYSLPRKNVNYVIKWLTDFVSDYGVDGFRCDTAKHVEKENWGTLSKCGTKALQEWREKEKKNNPDNPAAYWDEDFWTTGEAWGHGVDNDDYYTTGGFDSMINFSFQGNESKSGSALEDIYSSYANKINSNSNFNVLSYISSHDTALGARSANAGTALLLCPGGVQIFYGDETGRKAGSGDGKQPTRSHMNWDSIDKTIQSNWQKVGQFRKNHASVGAGQHKQLTGDVYTFSRTYHLGEADEDKVVVALPTKAGTFTVNVGNVFEDGESVTDAYSGETYQVSGGSVSATCDSNGVILLESTREVKPSIGASLKDGSVYKTETVNVTLNGSKVTDTYYSLNGGEQKAYEPGTVLTFGGDTAYGEKTELTITGKSEEDGSVIEKTYTYTRSEEPAISDGICVKVDKSEFATAPTIYVYDDKSNALNGEWPGNAMSDDGDCWSWEYDGDLDSVNYIIKWGDGAEDRSTPDSAAGLVATGGVKFIKATKSTEEISVSTPGRVEIKYVDEAGKVLKEIYRVGAVGDTYTTYAANLPGQTLKETPDNATGKFTEETVTVTYVYAGGETPTDTPIPTVTDTPDPTKAPDETATPIPTATETPDITEAPDETATPIPTVTDTPDPTKAPDETATPTPTSGPTEFVMDNFITANSVNGGKLLIANASADKGSIRYMFTIEYDGKEVLLRNFSEDSRLEWVPVNKGSYKLNAYAINQGTILKKTLDYEAK